MGVEPIRPLLVMNIEVSEGKYDALTVVKDDFESIKQVAAAFIARN